MIHMYWAQFMLQWFIRLPEFAEFNESSDLFRENFIESYLVNFTALFTVDKQCVTPCSSRNRFQRTLPIHLRLNGSFTLQWQWQRKTLFSIYLCRHNLNTTTCCLIPIFSVAVAAMNGYWTDHDSNGNGTKYLFILSLSPQCERTLRDYSHHWKPRRKRKTSENKQKRLNDKYQRKFSLPISVNGV